MLINQIGPHAFHKLSIKTVWFGIYRIICSVSCTANTEAIFLNGVTWYTEPRILFWDHWLDLFFFVFTRLNSEKHVSTFMGTPASATRPHPTLGLHEVNSSQSEVLVGEEASLQLNFCSELEWKLQKSAKILPVLQVTSLDLFWFSSEVSTSGLFINPRAI